MKQLKAAAAYARDVAHKDSKAALDAAANVLETAAKSHNAACVTWDAAWVAHDAAAKAHNATCVTWDAINAAEEKQNEN